MATENTTTEFTIEKITTGIQTGDLIANEDGLDVDASINKYAEMVQSALDAEFPDAEVDVIVENSSGSTPWNLQTHVYLRDEPDVEDDFDGYKRAQEFCEGVSMRVDSLVGTVYGGFAWLVTAEIE